MTWKYRGQVLPTATRVTVDLEIVEKGDDYAVANASLWVDGLRIYEASRPGDADRRRREQSETQRRRGRKGAETQNLVRAW